MDSEGLIYVLAHIINITVSICVLAALLRFLLQLVKADYFNPVSQFVVRLTDPALHVFQRFIPDYQGFGFPILALAYAEALLGIALLNAAYDFEAPVIVMVNWAFLSVAFSMIDICFWAVVISIILSFVMLVSNQAMSHPIARLAWQISEPLLAPFRRMLPSLGGLDFSPIFLFMGLWFLEEMLMSGFRIGENYGYVIVGSFGLWDNFLRLPILILSVLP